MIRRPRRLGAGVGEELPPGPGLREVLRDDLRSSRGHEAQTKTPDIDQSLLTSGATQETGRPLTPALSPSGGEGGRRATVSIEDSSQFASALLLGAKQGGWEVKVVGENAEESPYVAMTSEMVKAFPHRGGEFQIEPDASSGSYFWGAGWLLFKSPIEGDLIKTLEELRQNLQQGKPLPSQENEVVISIWPDSHWQIDADFTIFIRSGLGEIPIDISRAHDLGDSIMTAIVLAPFNRQSVTFTELGRLRVQECERVVALRTELTQCGAKVVEEGDTLTVFPSQLHGAEIETYNDHRMAMCFAILGLKVTGIKIKNPACVKKTFPNFFQKLATPPPQGLGATILDGHTGRKLALEELFAD